MMLWTIWEEFQECKDVKMASKMLQDMIMQRSSRATLRLVDTGKESACRPAGSSAALEKSTAKARHQRAFIMYHRTLRILAGLSN